MIENDFIYVDQTEKIYRLLTNEFISFTIYPRRFGKSLFLSTVLSFYEENFLWWEKFAPDLWITEEMLRKLR